MPRLFRLAIAMLPLALGAAVAGAQEPPPRHAPPGQEPAVRPPSQREARPTRESLTQWRRDRGPGVRQSDASGAAERAAQAPYTDPVPGPRPISDAVRQVQRSTGGQILGAEQVPYEGRSITRVKYMDERGRVRYMDYPGGAERRAPRRADNDAP